jgi:ferric-dicitrate binding protein FerR (iron transport regulator)
MKTFTEAPGRDHPGDAALEALARAARRDADAAVPEQLSPLGWERLQRARLRHERALRLRLAGAALAAVLVVTAAAGGKLWSGRPRAISYRVEGAAMGETGYIHDIGVAGARLRFSEGTKIDLEADARAWIVSSSPEGARLRLENGRAHFDVVHRPKGHWSVDAGPFAIAITGTVFDVRWVGAEEILEVGLLRGSVTIAGPLVGQGVTLRPGQRLISHPRERLFRIEERPAPDGPAAAPVETSAAALPAPVGAAPPDRGAAARAEAATTLGEPSKAARAAGDTTANRPRAAAPVVVAVRDAAAPAGGRYRRRPAPAALAPNTPASTQAKVEAPTAPPGAPAPASPAEAPPGPEVDGPPAPGAPGAGSWPQRVAAGDYRGVIGEAEGNGIGACITACDGAALAALADAARYAGMTELARRALLAEWQRFPGSRAAQTAAFLLGRMSDEDGLAPRAALAWYDRYLAAAPDGAYAAEALGRKMLVVDRLGERASARRIAAEYLRRFPSGSYLPQATFMLKER